MSVVISVADPVKQSGDGFNEYVSYKVNTRIEQTDAGGAHDFRNFRAESSVLRRYNDFGWLYQQLEAAFPGCVIPPLPEKLAVG